MELLVATWSLRLAIVGSLLVGGLSLSAGASVLDAVQRVALVVFLSTFGGRLLLDWLEPAEIKAARRHARRSRARRDRKRPHTDTRAAGPASTRQVAEAWAPNAKRPAAHYDRTRPEPAGSSAGLR